MRERSHVGAGVLATGVSLCRADPAPQRIVSLAPSITEISLRVRRRRRVVGVSMYCLIRPRRRGSPLRHVPRSQPFIAAGTGAYQDEIIGLAHGENLAAPIGKPWPNVALEFVVASAPQVIIDSSIPEPAPARPSGWWPGPDPALLSSA